MQRETEDVAVTGPEFPFFQWGNGLTYIATNVKGKWQSGIPAVGFFTDRTENQDEWTELDTACSAAGFEAIYIKRKEGASAHWFTPQMRMLVLTTKLPKLGSMYADRETLQKGGAIKRHGISFGWKINREKGDDGSYHVEWRGTNPVVESFMRPLVFVPELVAAGYDKPVMITLKGKMTEYMETALRRHYEIQDDILKNATALKFIDGVHTTMVNDLGVEAPEEWQFPFYGSYLTIGDGGQEPFGKGDKSKDCNVVAILEPEAFDDANLEALCADGNERVLCMSWMPQAIEWSLANTTRDVALREEEIDELTTMKAQLRAVNAAASKAA